MDWIGLVVNLVAIFAGLGIYIVVIRSKWGEEHQGYQYAIMLGAILVACLIGGMLRAVTGMIL